MSRQNNITEASAAAHYLMAQNQVGWTTGEEAVLDDDTRLAAAQVHALLAIYERLDLMHDTIGALG